eukprot:5498144-Prymnesium_polylepis.1
MCVTGLRDVARGRGTRGCVLRVYGAADANSMCLCGCVLRVYGAADANEEGTRAGTRKRRIQCHARSCMFYDSISYRRAQVCDFRPSALTRGRPGAGVRACCGPRVGVPVCVCVARA